MAFGFGINADLAEASRILRIGRFVTDGVLIPYVVGDRAADGVDFVERLRKERDASGTLRNDLEGTPGALGMLLVAEDADGVHLRPVLLLKLLDGLLQRFGAGVVLAICDDEDDFLFEARVLLQVVG